MLVGFQNVSATFWIRFVGLLFLGSKLANKVVLQPPVETISSFAVIVVTAVVINDGVDTKQATLPMPVLFAILIVLPSKINALATGKFYKHTEIIFTPV